MCSKQAAYGDVLCPLIAEACIAVCPPNTANFEVDNVRVAKIVGAGVSDSSLVRGVVIRRCLVHPLLVNKRPSGVQSGIRRLSNRWVLNLPAETSWPHLATVLKRRMTCNMVG